MLFFLKSSSHFRLNADEAVETGIDALLFGERVPEQPVLSFDMWLAAHHPEDDWSWINAAEREGSSNPWYRRSLRALRGRVSSARSTVTRVLRGAVRRIRQRE
jgi:hypothetical protein